MASTPARAQRNLSNTDAGRPVTGAEKIRKFREKKKLEDPEYAERESRRIENCRKKRYQNMTGEERSQYKAKTAERVRLCRQWKKEVAIESQGRLASCSSRRGKGFGSPQALGKAVRKISVHLPNSPSKQKAVVSGLASRIGLGIQNAMENHLQGITKQGLCEEVQQKVIDFYFRPDIVYTTPGMNDEMTIWKDGMKMKKRRYYLVMFLKEAFNIFKALNPDVTIGFSKFATLRPENVLLLKQQPADQCKCRVHENFTLKLAPLKITYGGEFWQKILCDACDLHNDCWSGNCDKCKNGRLLTIGAKDQEQIYWKQWQKDDITGRLKLTTVHGCVGELREEILNTLPAFQEHVRVKRIQSNAFEHDKQDGNTCVLQCDFAMAYSSEYQNEVQSALWSRQSVNLFTAAVFYKNEPRKSYLIVTDSQDKGKDSVYVFMHKLAEVIPSLNSSEKLVIYTDGPSSEFKNKFMVKLLSILEAKLGCKISWKYFATSHGKGVVDGIEGSAKSLVRTKVMSKGSDALVVQNSMDFAQAANALMPDVRVIEEELKQVIAADDPWSSVECVPGISKVHSMICQEGNVELYHTDTDAENKSSACLSVNYGCVFQSFRCSQPPQPQVSHLKVGDWVIVQYDGSQYPGEVSEIVDNNAKVSVMHASSGGTWKWPDQEDIIFYKSSDVIRKILPSIPKGSRGQFTFSNL